MSESRELVFQRDGELADSLPVSCIVSVSCYGAPEIQQLIAATLEGALQSLAGSGMDLRALDGVTFTEDCAAASRTLQKTPEGHVPLGMGEQPDTSEMARTVPVWRNDELRFHIVLRAGLGIGMLSTDRAFHALAYGCVAHEAGHVEHEGHLYRSFPQIYGRPIPCGDRSRPTFLKAMDVWSEYAACRSSAMFRPEAVEEFEKVFCRALENSLFVARRHLAEAKSDTETPQGFVDIPQLFGDVFICAGYFLGHLDGLELDLEQHAPNAWILFVQHPEIGASVRNLQRTLNELWMNEYEWDSIEVFTPIYEIICSMMAGQGFALAKTGTGWNMVTQT